MATEYLLNPVPLTTSTITLRGPTRTSTYIDEAREVDLDAHDWVTEYAKLNSGWTDKERERLRQHQQGKAAREPQVEVTDDFVF